MKEAVFKGFEGQEVIISGADMNAFESDLRGYAIMPDSGQYEEARALWNGMIDKRPARIST